MPSNHMLMTTLVAAALTIGASHPALAADTHAHAAGTPAALALDHGRKWASDEPLRRHMGDLHGLLATEIESIHADRLSPADYRVLGAAVEQKVAAIVAECKLPPDADAVLHLIVADLVAGAEIMQGKASGNPADGAHKVVEAANAYGRYFAHPGWNPLG